MKVGWLADSFERPGRRRAHPGGVPRRGARGRRGRRRARPTGSSGSPAATSPASTTASPIRPRDGRRARGQAGRSATGTTSPGRAAPGDPALDRWAAEHATSVFTSPLHRDRFPHRVEGESAPDPARDRPRALRRAGRAQARAAPAGSARRCTPARGCSRRSSGPRRTSRSTSGACSPDQVAGLAADPGARATSRPSTCRDPAAATERFVFLPTTVEPFGRAVVEAWAAGCELIVNRNVGALHWLENPDGARDRGRRLLARSSGGWQATAEAPDPQQRSLVAVGLRPADGAVRAAARRAHRPRRSAPSTASRTRRSTSPA